MNKGKTFRGFCRGLVFFALLLLCIYGASRLLMDKKSLYYKSEFFNSGTDFDILFFGSSHMHEGIDPVYLWENYGISSYNLASSGESMTMSYYVAAEALEDYNPKAIVIDSFKIEDKEDTIGEGYGFVHETIDALPFNKNKIEAIKYASRFFDGGALAFLSNIYAYHARFSSLTENDFTNYINYDKGAYIMTSICKVERPKELTRETTELGNGDGVLAYKRLLNLCNEKGVKCILVNIPASEAANDLDSQRLNNALMEYTKENGGDAINFNYLIDEIGIDYEHDFGDSSHLNFMGANKTADYLADYLIKNYNLEDRREDESYSAIWTSDLKKWEKQKIKMLSEKTEAVSYLFGADDENFRVELYIKDMDTISNQYGLDFCIEEMGLEPVETGNDILKGFDMKVVVRNKEDNTWLAEQYFSLKDSSE